MIKPTNHRAVILAALVGMVCVAVRAQTAPAAAARTPAEIGIQKAREQIARQPDYAPNYSRLAIAYARRARETSDAGYYAKAEEMVERSFKLEPGNFEASKVRTLLLLDRQEFAQALESAKALHQRVSDDIEVY